MIGLGLRLRIERDSRPNSTQNEYVMDRVIHGAHDIRINCLVKPVRAGHPRECSISFNATNENDEWWRKHLNNRITYCHPFRSTSSIHKTENVWCACCVCTLCETHSTHSWRQLSRTQTYALHTAHTNAHAIRNHHFDGLVMA